MGTKQRKRAQSSKTRTLLRARGHKLHRALPPQETGVPHEMRNKARRFLEKHIGIQATDVETHVYQWATSNEEGQCNGKKLFLMKMRQLLHNLQHNQTLRNNLNSGTTTAREIVRMSADQLASPELAAHRKKLRAQQLSAVVLRPSGVINTQPITDGDLKVAGMQPMVRMLSH